MKLTTILTLLVAVSAAPVRRVLSQDEPVAPTELLHKRAPRVVYRTHTAEAVLVTNTVYAPAVTVTAGQEPAPAPAPAPAPEPTPAPAPAPVEPAPAPAPAPEQPSEAAPEPVQPAPAPEPVEPSPTPIQPAPEPAQPAPEPSTPAAAPEPTQEPVISVVVPPGPSTTLVLSTVNPPQPSSSSAAPEPTNVPAPGGIIPYSLTYSPYNDDSSCKNAGQVLADLREIANKGIKIVRIYGTDCGSIQTVQPAAQQLGLRLDQGFWIGPSGVDSIDQGVQEFIDWASSNNGWGLIDTITVGNEAIIAGYVNAQQLLGKIRQVKGQLQAAGYQGQVTTAEPAVTYTKNPDLCTGPELDYVGINSHAYFNPQQSPETAGQFALDEMDLTRRTCNNKVVFVTETGYPSAGNVNGNNTPSPANQAIAINSLLKALNGHGTFFTMFDDYWKAPGPYNVEQHFGIINILQ